MENTITKGTGNSRSLRSVPNLLTLYPTWAAAAQAMIDGTFPIDLGALNPAGCEQIGDDLNKANLLSDETAALYPGLPENPVPDDVLAKIASSISAALSASTVTYVGSGVSTKKISFGFPPKIVFVLDGNSGYYGVFINPATIGLVVTNNSSSGGSPVPENKFVRLVWSGNSLSISATDEYSANATIWALNASNRTYYVTEIY